MGMAIVMKHVWTETNLITVQQSMQIIMHKCVTLYVTSYLNYYKIIKGWGVSHKKVVFQILISYRGNKLIYF